MKVSVFYTVLSVLNLIVFAIVVACLPASVAVQFKGLTVDRLGSAWVYIAFPAVTALLALGVFMLRLKAKERGKGYLDIISLVLVAAGAIFACIAWTFLGLAAQGALFGEKVTFPYAAVTALPLSLLVIAFGFALYDCEKSGLRLPLPKIEAGSGAQAKLNRLGGIEFMIAGLLSAVLSIVFTCMAPALGYIAIVIVVVATAAVYWACVMSAQGMRR